MPELDPIEVSHSTCLRRLDEHAREDAPRLFALYGIYNTGRLDLFCGWGMEWPAQEGEGAGGAVFYDRADRSTWHGESARHILADHKLFAETHLLWLANSAERGPVDASYELSER